MMHSSAHYDYMEGADFQGLKLPYAGNELAMYILLPRDAAGLPQLEKELTPKLLSDSFGRFFSRQVAVTMPKFKMTGEYELRPPLEAMGMPAAFEGADFSGMTGKQDLSISNVIHKAFVEVNEEGTEAAAATGVVMAFAMARPAEPAVFRADHPFLFVIRDEKSGAFLFLGRLADPG
jgi:serpin B